jgi:hypothetical protein
MKISKIVAITFFVLVSLSYPYQRVFAEGPGTGGRRIRLENEPAGPYLLRVVTSPTPPRVENLYLEVRVTDAGNANILTDLNVTVRAFSTEGEPTSINSIATHDIAPIPDEYAAHLLIPRAGVWNIVVQVDGPLGSGETSFLERVSGPSSLGPIISIGAPFGGLAILIIIFLRMQRNSGEEKDEEDNP